MDENVNAMDEVLSAMETERLRKERFKEIPRTLLPIPTRFTQTSEPEQPNHEPQTQCVEEAWYSHYIEDVRPLFRITQRKSIQEVSNMRYKELFPDDSKTVPGGKFTEYPALTQIGLISKKLYRGLEEVGVISQRWTYGDEIDFPMEPIYEKPEGKHRLKDSLYLAQILFRHKLGDETVMFIEDSASYQSDSVVTGKYLPKDEYSHQSGGWKKIADPGRMLKTMHGHAFFQTHRLISIIKRDGVGKKIDYWQNIKHGPRFLNFDHDGGLLAAFTKIKDGNDTRIVRLRPHTYDPVTGRWADDQYSYLCREALDGADISHLTE